MKKKMDSDEKLLERIDQRCQDNLKAIEKTIETKPLNREILNQQISTDLHVLREKINLENLRYKMKSEKTGAEDFLASLEQYKQDMKNLGVRK